MGALATSTQTFASISVAEYANVRQYQCSRVGVNTCQICADDVSDFKNDDDDEENESYIESDHDSESEIHFSDSDDLVFSQKQQSISYYFGREKGSTPKTKWSKLEPPQNSRTRQHNLIKTFLGLKPPAKKLGTNPSQIEVWKLLFSSRSFTIWDYMILESVDVFETGHREA
ncbi:hypothetical protein FQR65_LT14297 [Abscondita terminalis]|nr:hypothetical protein FQR65_LT14297 [Abscondita terminalis]